MFLFKAPMRRNFQVIAGFILVLLLQIMCKDFRNVFMAPSERSPKNYAALKRWKIIAIRHCREWLVNIAPHNVHINSRWEKCRCWFYWTRSITIFASHMEFQCATCGSSRPPTINLYESIARNAEHSGPVLALYITIKSRINFRFMVMIRDALFCFFLFPPQLKIASKRRIRSRKDLFFAIELARN